MSVSYQTIVLTALGNLEIPDGVNFYFTNRFNTSTRNSPYMELIFQINEGDTEYAIYNTFLKYTSNNLSIVETNDADQIIIPPTSKDYYRLEYMNDKRFYTCDSQMYYGFTESSFGPPNLYFSYKNCLNAILQVPNGNGVYPSSGGAYTVSNVSRYAIFWYYPATTVYLLIDFNNSMNTSYGFSIFVMQSFCKQIYPVTEEGLNTLNEVLINPDIVGSDNVLPTNWIYSYSILNKDFYLNAVSIGTAYQTQDGLSNTYTYVDPSYCNQIYEQYTTKQDLVFVNSKSTTLCKTTFKNDTQLVTASATATATATGNTITDSFQSSADNSVNVAQETSLNVLLSIVPDTNGQVESICTTTTTGVI